MPKIEDAQNINSANSELDPGESEVVVKDINELEEANSVESPASLEQDEAMVEQTKPSPEEQISSLENESRINQEEITRLTETVENTKTKINEIRQKMGLPYREEDTPSVLSEKDKLEKLLSEQETLERQKEELIGQQEKEKLIREEKEKIMQEKIEELFNELRSLRQEDFESIFQTGKTVNGQAVESNAMGTLEPDTARALANAFEEGIKFLPEILKNLPDIFEKWNEDLMEEATRRIEQMLEEEKKKLEQESPKPKQPEEEATIKTDSGESQEVPTNEPGEPSEQNFTRDDTNPGDDTVDHGTTENPET